MAMAAAIGLVMAVLGGLGLFCLGLDEVRIITKITGKIMVRVLAFFIVSPELGSEVLQHDVELAFVGGKVRVNHLIGPRQQYSFLSLSDEISQGDFHLAKRKARVGIPDVDH